MVLEKQNTFPSGTFEAPKKIPPVREEPKKILPASSPISAHKKDNSDVKKNASSSSPSNNVAFGTTIRANGKERKKERKKNLLVL